MATKTNLARFVVLINLIVFSSNQVLRSEARVLAGENVESTSHRSVESPSYKDLGKQRFNVDDDGYMDSYRPTTPGRSPGIGHSKHD
ncbi:transmembrane protein [Perilla frutescens var. hirtella]|nr:transmembrane protein [Perilla frutescens var. hirtella]